jgi:hypothetical protein
VSGCSPPWPQFAFGGFANGFLLGPLTTLLGGSPAAVVSKSLLVMCLAYGVQAALYHPLVASSLGLGLGGAAPFLAMTMLLSMFQYCLGTSITAQTTTMVDARSKGTLIGMEHSFFSAARVVGPTVGVMLLTRFGLSGLSGAIGCVFLCLFFTAKSALSTVGRRDKAAKAKKAH